MLRRKLFKGKLAQLNSNKWYFSKRSLTLIPSLISFCSGLSPIGTNLSFTTEQQMIKVTITLKSYVIKMFRE